jgi:hypothetical protein
MQVSNSATQLYVLANEGAAARRAESLDLFLIICFWQTV